MQHLYQADKARAEASSLYFFLSCNFEREGSPGRAGARGGVRLRAGMACLRDLGTGVVLACKDVSVAYAWTSVSSISSRIWEAEGAKVLAYFISHHWCCFAKAVW
jgi:hypothetical protein